MKRKSPTAAQVLEAKKAELEAAILRLCGAFERDTGMIVSAIIHPRDQGDDRHPIRELAEGECVKVNALPPFIHTTRYR